MRAGFEQQAGRGRRQQQQPLWGCVRRQDLLVDAVGGLLLWRVRPGSSQCVCYMHQLQMQGRGRAAAGPDGDAVGRQPAVAGEAF